MDNSAVTLEVSSPTRDADVSVLVRSLDGAGGLRREEHREAFGECAEDLRMWPRATEVESKASQSFSVEEDDDSGGVRDFACSICNTLGLAIREVDDSVADNDGEVGAVNTPWTYSQGAFGDRSPDLDKGVAVALTTVPVECAECADRDSVGIGREAAPTCVKKFGSCGKRLSCDRSGRGVVLPAKGVLTPEPGWSESSGSCCSFLCVASISTDVAVSVDCCHRIIPSTFTDAMMRWVQRQNVREKLSMQGLCEVKGSLVEYYIVL